MVVPKQRCSFDAPVLLYRCVVERVCAGGRPIDEGRQNGKAQTCLSPQYLTLVIRFLPDAELCLCKGGTSLRFWNKAMYFCMSSVYKISIFSTALLCLVKVSLKFAYTSVSGFILASSLWLCIISNAFQNSSVHVNVKCRQQLYGFIHSLHLNLQSYLVLLSLAPGQKSGRAAVPFFFF